MISFGAFLVHSVLFLYLVASSFVVMYESALLVHSVFSLYPPSLLHSLALSGYYFMPKGALKPCRLRLGVRPEEWT